MAQTRKYPLISEITPSRRSPVIREKGGGFYSRSRPGARRRTTRHHRAKAPENPKAIEGAIVHVLSEGNFDHPPSMAGRHAQHQALASPRLCRHAHASDCQKRLPPEARGAKMRVRSPAIWPEGTTRGIPSGNLWFRVQPKQGEPAFGAIDDAAKALLQMRQEGFATHRGRERSRRVVTGARFVIAVGAVPVPFVVRRN